MYYGEELKKYQIVYLDLGQKKLNSSIQVGKRYAIIVSNDKANKYSTILEVIPFTSQQKRLLPTHLDVAGFGLTKQSTLLAEQVTTISKMRVIRKVGKITDEDIIKEINKKIIVSLGLL